MAQVEELKATAENYGVTPEFTAEVLTKYGPDVLAITIKALQSGFSWSFVLEVFKRFGPVVLEFFLNLFTTSTKAMQDQEQKGLVASDITLADFLNDKNAAQFAPIITKVLLDKIIPYIIQNYGTQILQGILDAVKSSMDTKETARFLELVAQHNAQAPAN